jgi:hypothetical protein
MYFLDADDDVDLDALVEATKYALSSFLDLLFLPYELSMSGKLKPMFNSDATLWKVLVRKTLPHST